MRCIQYEVIFRYDPEADAPDQSGRYGYGSPEDDSSVDFRYRIVRLWERPVEALIAGGLGTLRRRGVELGIAEGDGERQVPGS